MKCTRGRLGGCVADAHFTEMRPQALRGLVVVLVASLALTVVAAESPAVAKYRTLKEELLTCPESAFEAKRTEMLKFIADPGETNAVQLVEFYLDVVGRDTQGVFEKPDCWALAEKATAGAERSIRIGVTRDVSSSPKR